MNKYLTLLIALFAALQIHAYDTIIDNLEYDWGEWSYNGSSDWAAITLVGYRYSYNLPENLVVPSSVKWDSHYNGFYGRMCRVSRVNSGSFRNCSKLKSVNLPYVIHISTCAFENCNNLKKVVFSDAIKYIESSAFAGCTSLAQICIERTDPPSDIKSDAFDSDTYKIATLYVPKGCVNVYKRSSFWSKFLNITDETPKETYSLSIAASGNGSATYNSTTIRSKTSSFTVTEGTSATITFTPDNGYRIKSVKVNGSTVTVSNNKYTISSITDNTTVSVEFEAIPITTYTLSISATGNGSVSYNSTTIRNKTNSFTVNEGTSATITFTPDNGYRIKTVKVNGSTVTVSNNKYTISSINSNTTVSVEFEAIPASIDITQYVSATSIGGAITQTNNLINSGSQLNWSFSNKSTQSVTLNSLQLIDGQSGTAGNKMSVNQVVEANSSVSYTTTIGAAGIHTPVTCRFWYSYNGIDYSTDAVYNDSQDYTLSIKVKGNGQVQYNGNTIRNTTESYSVAYFSSVILVIKPDNGYQIKSVKLNNSDVTSSVSNNVLTIIAITSNQSVEVEFEAIPITTYTLSITSSGNGSASYNSTTIRNKTTSFTVNEGTSATITFTPDNGYKIKSVKVNGSTVTVSNNKYTISSINSNTTVSVEFEAIPITTYTLSITASGNGSASYNSTTIRSKTTSFTVNEGSSVTITFTPDNGYKIKSVKVNGSTVTVSNNKYTISSINSNTTVSVEFEAITYTLSITASGNGSVSYDGTTIRSKTSSFTVNEGISATITFTPDNGYRIKSVKVNGSTVTVSNYKYTISSISGNTTVNVEFEAITYTLSITASGNGSASYDGTTIRSKTSSFTVNEGTSATITFNPDNGYRIKSVKVNGSTVTVSDNKYTISSISGNTTVNVEFEAIPITIYTLSITASGNGSASYDGTTIRSKTSSFTVNEGTSATITFTPDNGYRIKSVKVNGSTVTVSNNKYTISSISGNTTVNVEFEAIPITTYTLSITASGNGSASYNSTTIRNKTTSFTVNEGTTAIVTFTPDNGYRIKSVKLNGTDVTSYVSNKSYTISNITKNSTLEVEFAEELTTFTSNGINYSVSSYDDRTIIVGGGNYGRVLEVPAEITYQGMKWKVIGIDNAALADNTELAAIIWNPAAMFTINVSNSNLLLYVTSANYAPSSITNVIVNTTANKIVLSDAVSGNDFYCPKNFTAKSISYTHNYLMTTGIGESRGWESIALPFDVQKIAHSSKGEIIPFANWKSGDSKKPFWLMTYGTGGWSDASSIKANTPYIISMPNHSDYKTEFRMNGKITFSAANVTVKKSDDIQIGSYDGKTFVPCFVNEDNNSYYTLNVNSDYLTYYGEYSEGSRFVQGLRAVHPFEAYLTSSSSAARSIVISDDMTTGIEDISVLIDESKGVRVYNMKGQLMIVEKGQSLDDVKKRLPAGVYVVNGKKLIIK